jgi:hypothetical protein
LKYGKAGNPLTGEALIKEVCRRIRVPVATGMLIITLLVGENAIAL